MRLEGTPAKRVELRARALRQGLPGLSAAEALDKAFWTELKRPQSNLGRIAEKFPEALRGDMDRDVGILSLSEVPDHILMWSHYADCHRGLCLEFSTDSTFFKRAEPIRYSQEFPVFDYFETNADERARMIALTKADFWSYEKEWRIVDTDAGPGIQRYPAKALRRVIFGSETPKDLEAKVRRWVEAADIRPQFTRAQRHPQEYRLLVESADQPQGAA